jgi:aldose 1-epimerase
MRNPQVNSHPFGAMPDGGEVHRYSISNGTIALEAINYGAIITSLRVPDRNGRSGDVVLGHETLPPYLDNRAYLGAVVGRYANRVAGGRFELDGTRYQLATNDAANHLHGGVVGFDRRVWNASFGETSDGPSIRFERISPAGEEGYPGTLHVAVTYQVTSSNVVSIRYDATTDAPTIVNLTQHTYFNLSGEKSVTTLDHELQIHADHYLPVDDTLIPTGDVAEVSGTPFDFREPASLRSRIALDHQQLQTAAGFDHTFVFAAVEGPVACLSDPASGRRLEIGTTEPGVQFYGGQLLDGRTTAAYGRTLGRYAGLCLETHHFPDSPNRPHFPAVTLRPDNRYTSTTTWRFVAE